VTAEHISQGSLFSTDFLQESIARVADWQLLTDDEIDALTADLRVWDEERRLKLLAKLDAVYFHLYGVTDRDDVRYIYSTFPIVEREEMAAYGRYRSCELCLAWMSALAAGDPDAKIEL
jgi:hypothetical protein